MPKARPLVYIFCFALAIALGSYYLLYQARHPSIGLATNGPLKLSFLKTPSQPDQLQLEARLSLTKTTPALQASDPKNDRTIHAVNIGRGTIKIRGYSPSAPWYVMEIKKDDVWTPVPMAYASTSSPSPSIPANGSLDFPVIVPPGKGSWRIGLDYIAMPATGGIDSFLNRISRFLGSPPVPRHYVAWSEEMER